MPKHVRTAEHNAKIREAHLARGVGKSPTKICPRCTQDLPRSAYRTRSNGFTHSYCVPCELQYNRAKSLKHWQAHPEKRPVQKAQNRRTTLMRYHGMTVEGYEQMLAEQRGVCAICGGHQTHGRTNLDVDHCHQTGERRGLLCSHCNRGIGLMGDDPARLRAAADYLEKARGRHHAA